MVKGGGGSNIQLHAIWIHVPTRRTGPSPFGSLTNAGDSSTGIVRDLPSIVGWIGPFLCLSHVFLPSLDPSVRDPPSMNMDRKRFLIRWKDSKRQEDAGSDVCSAEEGIQPMDGSHGSNPQELPNLAAWVSRWTHDRVERSCPCDVPMPRCFTSPDDRRSGYLRRFRAARLGTYVSGFDDIGSREGEGKTSRCSVRHPETWIRR